MKLTEKTRKELKAFLTAHHQWDVYRRALPARLNGAPANSGNMTKAEWLDAAAAFNVDMTLLGNGMVATVAPVVGQPMPRPENSDRFTTLTVSAVDGEDSDTETGAGDVDTVEAIAAPDGEAEAALAPMATIQNIVSPKVWSDTVANVQGLVDNARKAGAVTARPAAEPIYLDASTGLPVARDSLDTTEHALINKPVGSKPAIDVFGSGAVAGMETLVDVWSGDCSPDGGQYKPDSAILRTIIAAVAGGQPVWMYGPAGTGKTHFAMWYAAKTGRGFSRICLNGESEVAPFIGQYLPSGADEYEYKHGAFLQAIARPGEIVLIDEYSSATHAVQTFIQTAMDYRYVIIPETGERVDFASGVVVMVADNTAGFGDETGAHHGKYMVDRAALDRFACVVNFDYPSKSKEKSIVAAQTGLDKAAAAVMVEYAGMVRDAAQKGVNVSYPLTIRRLLAWGTLVVNGLDSKTAFSMSCLNMAGPDVDGLIELEKAYLWGNDGGHAQIDAAQAGVEAPQKPETVTPEGEAAAGDFDVVDSL